MTKEQLLETTYESAYAAMCALNDFLQEVDNLYGNGTRGNYQNLKAIGNRIYE